MTPGQAAQEMSVAILRDRFGDTVKTWTELSDGSRADWEDIGQAASADLRELVAEILGHLDDAGITVDDEIRGAWRERAGLEG